jgi:hypothetical protein
VRAPDYDVGCGTYEGAPARPCVEPHFLKPAAGRLLPPERQHVRRTWIVAGGWSPCIPGLCSRPGLLKNRAAEKGG